MFEIGDKVRVRKDYWEIYDLVYKGWHRHLLKVKKEMAKAIGKIFTIKDKTENGYYLLVDNENKSDGFAWKEGMLEKVD